MLKVNCKHKAKESYQTEDHKANNSKSDTRKYKFEKAQIFHFVSEYISMCTLMYVQYIYVGSRAK